MEGTTDKKAHVSRSKHKCPFPDCKSDVVHLPRHMKCAHGWSKERASGVLKAFDLRKPKTLSSKKKARKFKRKICPVRNCNGVVKRIHNHLTDVHNLKRNDKMYKVCLEAAVVHDSKDLPSLSESSEEDVTSDPSDKQAINQGHGQCSKSSKEQKRHPSIFKKIYSSDEGSSNDEPDWASVTPVEEMDTTNQDGVGDDRDLVGEDNENPPLNSNNETTVLSSRESKKILSSFQEWLKGPDGGRKDEKCANQCKRQVQMVIEFIDSKNPSLTLLMSKRTIRDKWLTEFEKVKQPGTVKSYLGTLNLFYLFIQVECADKFEALNVSQPDLISLSNQVKLWARSYRKLSQDRFWEKRVEDLANKKTPEDIRKFDSSEVARTAVKTIGEFNEQDQLLTQVEYTNVRDYLLTVICINNGSRSGSLANMTLEEFKQATLEEGCYVVRVKKHKTFTTHGPVNVVLHLTLHKYVEIFISKMRNCLPDTNLDTKETVFLTWKGCEMYSSHVGSQIGSCWGKVFGKEASTGGATSFRKAAVSAVHEANKEIRGDLANLMVHNRATADKYYLLEDKGKTAVRTSKELSRIMRDAHCAKTRNDTSGEPSTSSCVAVVTHRHKWKKDESAAVATLFAKNIQDQSISLEEVRNLSKDHVILSKISASKIRDKIRSLFTQNDPDDPEELPSLPEECETPEERLERFGIPPAAGK